MKKKEKRNLIIYGVGNLLLIAKYFWDSLSINCEPCLAGEPCPPCQTYFMANFAIYFLVWNVAMGAFFLNTLISLKREPSYQRSTRNAFLFSALLHLIFSLLFRYYAIEHFIQEKIYEGFVVLIPVGVFCILQIIPLVILLSRRDWWLFAFNCTSTFLVGFLAFQSFSISLQILPYLMLFYAFIFWHQFRRKAISTLPPNV